MEPIDGLRLARMWAEPNDVPTEQVLFRLGYDADSGAFGDRAFVDGHGLHLDNASAAESFWRLSIESNPEVLRRESEGSPLNFFWPHVRADALAFFCKAVNTYPPLGVALGPDFAPKHRFPPAPDTISGRQSEVAVSWFERLADAVATGRRRPDERLALAKMEARVLAHGWRRATGNASLWRRYKTAKAKLKGDATEPREEATQRKIDRRGHPPGSGSLEADDVPILEEMRELIENGVAPSASAAAATMLDRAADAGTPASKIARLVKRYRAKFSENSG